MYSSPEMTLYEAGTPRVYFLQLTISSLPSPFIFLSSELFGSRTNRLASNVSRIYIELGEVRSLGDTKSCSSAAMVTLPGETSSFRSSSEVCCL